MDDKKFIESYDISDYQILTDNDQWVDCVALHKTIPYQIYHIYTKNFQLKCADTHIVYTCRLQEIFVKDLKIGDYVYTELGYQKLTDIVIRQHNVNMFDLELDILSNHRYFTNGILSHNTTTYTIFALWYILIHKNKNILICANRFKTAKEILGRIKLAYEMLPNWLKPGVIEWNASNVVFDNGCKIGAEATSENSGRAFSINCFSQDNQITLKQNNKILKVDMDQGYQLFPDCTDDIINNNFNDIKHLFEEYLI